MGMANINPTESVFSKRGHWHYRKRVDGTSQAGAVQSILPSLHLIAKVLGLALRTLVRCSIGLIVKAKILLERQVGIVK
jgi:hypothetical protein